MLSFCCSLIALCMEYLQKLYPLRVVLNLLRSLRHRATPQPPKGSQFTGQTFTGALAGHGVAISMDGKGAWRDNVFVERLWRSVKYEEVYLAPTTASAKPVLRSAGILTSPAPREP
jgi:transposase InsO family protein